ncbi:hypothetical protein GQR58_030555 [Nymphon striatum]|nr:hypothetical protein GQR58_030555 [Nymphon striatum]
MHAGTGVDVDVAALGDLDLGVLDMQTKRCSYFYSSWQEVDSADLSRVHVDACGGKVEHSLDELGCLGTSCTAVCTDRGRVGKHADAVELDLGHVVDGRSKQLGEHWQHRTECGVCASIGGDFGIHANNLAVVHQTELALHDHGPAMHHGDHVLGTEFRPLARNAELQGGVTSEHVFDVEARLRTEAAANPRGGTADLLLLEAEQCSHWLLQAVRTLVRTPEGQATFGLVRDCNCAVVFHRGTSETLREHLDRGDMIGTLEWIDVDLERRLHRAGSSWRNRRCCRCRRRSVAQQQQTRCR